MRSVSLFLFVGFVLAAFPRGGLADAQFRGGADHLGVYAEPTSAHNYAGLQWRFQTLGAVRSSPAVDNGTLYAGSSDHFLYALDATSGALRWKFDAGSAISSSPAIDGGIVYFQNYDNVVYGLDAATGAVRWKVATGANVAMPWGYESGDFWMSSPTIAGERILVGGGDTYLYALDRATGTIAWKAKTGGRIRSTAAVSGDTAYVGSDDGCLYAFNLADGVQKFAFKTAGADLDSGKFGYDRRSIRSSPAVSGGAVFFGARDGSIYAIDATTGTQRWHVSADVYWYLSSPAIDRGLAITGNSDARFIQAIATGSGKVAWALNTDINVFASPSVAGGVAYTGDWNGILHATDVSSGKDLWTFRSSGQRIFSSAAIDGKRVYFGSDDGAIYALNLTGRPALQRAVYYDDRYTDRAFLSAPKTMRDYFSKRRYEVLDASALATFMKARIADRVPSVVVFAIDDLPPEITGAGGGIFKQYLLHGGKVVWVGVPAGLWPFDVKAGDRELSGLSRANARALLGVGFEGGNFDPLTIRASGAGAKWGLLGSWLGAWAADPQTVTETLGEDEEHEAGAFVRNYGGPEGTGYVQIPLAMSADLVPLNLTAIQTAAEYFPRQ